ncbi:hypothetical protein Syun_029557 [Stephania yunnanensis]|uniref:Secreted protein n=1 Tax=Stephania yunnanensis TaxID=152371 RepID=A0AAP0HG49_9MAGN
MRSPVSTVWICLSALAITEFASPLSPSLDLPLRSRRLALANRHHLDLPIPLALAVLRSPVATATPPVRLRPHRLCGLSLQQSSSRRLAHGQSGVGDACRRLPLPLASPPQLSHKTGAICCLSSPVDALFMQQCDARARAGNGGKIDKRATYVHQPHVLGDVSRLGQHRCS